MLQAKLETDSQTRCQADLNTACEILEGILKTGQIDTSKVESFLKNLKQGKRKAQDPLKDGELKKIKSADLELHQSFDCFVSSEVRKRKHSVVTNEDLLKNQEKSDLNMNDIEKILEPPCKKVREKEKELDQLDEKIAKDRERFEAMTQKWSEREKVRLEYQKEAEKKKKYTLKLKQTLNEDLTGVRLKALAENTIPFLNKVYTGEKKSERHNQYFSKCGRESQNLLYTGISDPFTDEQADLVYAVIKDHFKSKKGIENNYIQWVLLSEALVQIYSEFFSIKDKVVALDLIQSCPVDESEDDDEEFPE